MRVVLASLLTLVVACSSRSSGAPTPPPPPARDAGAPTPPIDPRVARGGAAFQKYCALCHGPEAKGYVADHAPSLVTDQFLESADDAFIARSIELGRPNSPMAGYGKDLGGPLSDGDIADMIAWLRHGRPPYRPPPPVTGKGDAIAGAALYTATCQKCHGDRLVRAEAIQLGHPVFLALASDAFIRDAIVRGRPGTPMESFGALLSAQQIDDLVAHLRAWAVQPPPPQPPPPPDPIPSGPVVINPKGKHPTFTLRDDRFVPAAQVKAALAAKKKIVIVDARPLSDWLSLRIPGAISVPHYELAGLAAIPNDDTWVVAYCACPHHASGEIVDALRARGYKHTAVLDEGILFWHQQGYPVEGTAAKQPIAKPPSPPPPR
ncbi:MAG: c-type cytochrome [Myxococcales bacterium]|nr:c-type cytochrome [Myxococcales bacterium]